ncbi:MAG: hypothetical protein ABW219_06585 [Ilumatobacteraceae bacterium]
MTILFTANGAMALHEHRAGTADTTTPVAGQTFWDLIDRSDAALLDFSTDTLEHDIEHARALLDEQPTIYRNQLTIAKFIEGWVGRLVQDAEPCTFNEGFVEALVEMAGHLRDGDFATGPGGAGDHAPPV